MENEIKMPSQILVGERITLQRAYATIKNAERLFYHINSDRKTLSEWLSWVDKTEKVEDTLFFLKKKNDEWDDQKGAHYVIYQSADFVPHGGLMGTLDTVKFSHKDKSAELEYFLFNQYVGHGYIQEAVTLLEKELFSIGINRIVIRTDVLNIRSANVPKALGYTFEGITREDRYDEEKGIFMDTNVFSKLRSYK